MKYYQNKTKWRELHEKKRIRNNVQREGAARNKDRKDLEEFHYAAMYHALRTATASGNIAVTLRRLKQNYEDYQANKCKVCFSIKRKLTP